MKILIVEDKQELSRTICDYLAGEGYICEPAYTLEEANEKLEHYDYDCILLDIMLPDGTGMDILKKIHNEEIKANVLILSAKNALDDKITGLDLGADDYITKPFHLPELNARIRAIFRRKNLGGDPIVRCHEISLNTVTMEVKVHNQQLELTRKEYDLLLYFLTNQNRVITRHSIATHIWGDYTDNLANFDFVYQHVKNLRKKITQSGGQDYIHTVYGLGYKLDTRKA